MSDESKPCTYCGYTVSKYGRHGSSCPTYEIADLEKRLTAFEARTLELERNNHTLSLAMVRAHWDCAEREVLLRMLVIYEEHNTGFLPVITDIADRARKLLGMEVEE